MSDAPIERLRERFPRVAVVHEWLTIPGGSEDVVIELLEMFPKAELFTSIYDPEPWPAIVTERPVHASYLNRIPGAQAHYPKLLRERSGRALSKLMLLPGKVLDLVLVRSSTVAATL